MEVLKRKHQNNPYYKKDLKNLRFLAQIAEEVEPVSNASLAAMIIHKGYQPISIGTNKDKTHPFQARFGKNQHSIFIHAETDAICRALKSIDQSDLKKCTLYVCRTKKNGEWGVAKPCEGCWNAINEFEIGRVVWSLNGEGNFEHSEI